MSKQENLSKLPPFCASRLPSTNEPILIKAGERGYYRGWPGLNPEEFNAEIGVTEAQVSAMEAGSMFGWEVPGANPEIWEK